METLTSSIDNFSKITTINYLIEYRDKRNKQWNDMIERLNDNDENLPNYIIANKDIVLKVNTGYYDRRTI